MAQTYTGIDVAKDGFVVAIKLESNLPLCTTTTGKTLTASLRAYPGRAGASWRQRGCIACSWPSPCMRRANYLPHFLYRSPTATLGPYQLFLSPNALRRAETIPKTPIISSASGSVPYTRERNSC